MLQSKPARRSIALMLVVLGAVLMFLTTEAWAGGLLLALGISVELIGIAMKHK